MVDPLWMALLFNFKLIIKLNAKIAQQIPWEAFTYVGRMAGKVFVLETLM